eukprot:GEMP01032513.1.p1 GENE.GEMP01032513.1~~GEMP01032513.1.p1  ORF type:complete len:243 (+),score=39.44 GEMP01032513.1:217-945(+)
MGVLFILGTLSLTFHLPGVFGNVADYDPLQYTADVLRLDVYAPSLRRLQSDCEVLHCQTCNAENRNICDDCIAPYKKTAGKCEKDDEEENAFYLPWWVWFAIIVSVLISCIGCCLLCCWASGCISDEKLGIRKDKGDKKRNSVNRSSKYQGPQSPSPMSQASRAPQSGRQDRYPPPSFAPADESERSPKSPKKKRKKPKQEAPDWGAGDDWGGRGGQTDGYYDANGNWIAGYYDANGTWINT